MAETVVFCNGAFDCLHVGHLRFLEFSRQQGSSLVVAVNSDESIARRKGQFRPVVTLQERCEILLALCCVDRVVEFDDDPLVPIKSIVPQVYVVGCDYDDECPASKFVKERGGIVVRYTIRHQSTSDIVKRFRCS